MKNFQSASIIFLITSAHAFRFNIRNLFRQNSCVSSSFGDEVYTEINGEKVSKLGVGTWAWGDSLFWNYNSSQDADLKSAFNLTFDNGINFFDTAEIYGNGKSELLIGRFLRQYGDKQSAQSIALASKFAPFPWRIGKNAVVTACKDSLDRLGVDQMSLYQIHFPGIWQNEAYWEGLAECYHQGLVKSVGVSNYGPKQMKAAYKLLRSKGVPLSSNQVQYSLLSRGPESNGILRTAKELDIQVLAYSPLAQGLLTGKFNTTNLPNGPRSRAVKAALPKIQGLLKVLNDIGLSRSKTPAQVALNWCIAKGTIPIPGARNSAQARDNSGALGWILDKKEVAQLDIASRESGYNTDSLSFLQGS